MSDWMMERIKNGYGLAPIIPDDGINIPNMYDTNNFDEKDLIDAEKARELSENAISSEILYELKMVNKHIKNAINKGEYYCWYYMYLHDGSIKKLQELGYVISNHSNQKDGNCYKIAW